MIVVCKYSALVVETFDVTHLTGDFANHSVEIAAS